MDMCQIVAHFMLSETVGLNYLVYVIYAQISPPPKIANQLHAILLSILKTYIVLNAFRNENTLLFFRYCIFLTKERQTPAKQTDNNNRKIDTL